MIQPLPGKQTHTNPHTAITSLMFDVSKRNQLISGRRKDDLSFQVQKRQTGCVKTQQVDQPLLGKTKGHCRNVLLCLSVLLNGD